MAGKVVCGQGDVWGPRQSADGPAPAASLVFPVGYKVQGLDQLPVNHAHQIVEGFIGIRDAAEQGHLLFAHFLQMEVVGIGQPCNLREVKSGGARRR